jgi:hypothetical protein
MSLFKTSTSLFPCSIFLGRQLAAKACCAASTPGGHTPVAQRRVRACGCHSAAPAAPSRLLRWQWEAVEACSGGLGLVLARNLHCPGPPLLACWGFPVQCVHVQRLGGVFFWPAGLLEWGICGLVVGSSEGRAAWGVGTGLTHGWHPPSLSTEGVSARAETLLGAAGPCVATRAAALLCPARHSGGCCFSHPQAGWQSKGQLQPRAIPPSHPPGQGLGQARCALTPPHATGGHRRSS